MVVGQDESVVADHDGNIDRFGNPVGLDQRIDDFLVKDAKLGEQKPRVFNVTCKDGTQRVVSFIASALVSGDYLMPAKTLRT